MKQTIRLTESQFKKVITETVKKVLREDFNNDDDMLLARILLNYAMEEEMGHGIDSLSGGYNFTEALSEISDLLNKNLKSEAIKYAKNTAYHVANDLENEIEY